MQLNTLRHHSTDLRKLHAYPKSAHQWMTAIQNRAEQGAVIKNDFVFIILSIQFFFAFPRKGKSQSPSSFIIMSTQKLGWAKGLP